MNRTTELIERIKGLPDDAEWLILSFGGDDLKPCESVTDLKALAASHERMREALEFAKELAAEIRECTTPSACKACNMCVLEIEQQSREALKESAK